MKNLNMIINTVFAASCALLIGSKSFAEPMNIGQLKTELRTYQTSGAYNKEFSAVTNQAQAYIASQVAQNKQAKPSHKLALVLDIDDTSISNYANLESHDFCVNVDQFNKDIARGNDPVLAPMLMLYQQALKQGVAVFFVTGRPQTLNQATERNLKAAGYENWAGLFYRPASDKQPSVIPYKSQARAAIAQAGYTIIASLGDQSSDITGENTGRAFKLPNPYYYIP